MVSRPMVLLVLLALGLSCTPPAPAQGATPEDIQALQERVIALERQVLSHRGELEALRQLEGVLADGKGPQLQPESVPDPRTLDLIRSKLEGTHQKRQQVLAGLASQARQDREQALDVLASARRETLQLERLQEQEAERARQAAAARPFWDGTMALLLALGVAVFLVGLGLAGHEGRTGLRRWWRSGLRCLLAWALLGGQAPLSAQEADRDLRNRLEEEAARLEREDEKLTGEIARVRKGLEQQHARILEEWGRLLTPPVEAPSDTGSVAGPLAVPDWEKEVYQTVEGLLSDTEVTRLAGKEAETQLARAEALRDQLARAALYHRLGGFARSAARIALPAGFIVLAFVPMLRAVRARRSRRAEDARLCPRCLRKDTLEKKVNPQPSHLAPDHTHMRCAGCQHEFRASYLTHHRLCFPTVGVVESGKTRWLTTTYLRIKDGKFDLSAELQQAPSLADKEFDEKIKELFERSGDTTSTVEGLPDPLTFHLRDADALGPSEALLNLFDFSGEVMNKTIDEHEMRGRALLMDGFILFLDPTRIGGGWLELQNRALTSFHTELRDIRKLDVGAKIRVPIAVCISKIDMLGPEWHDWIRELRKTRGQPMSLATVRKRSRMCQKVVKAMFSGWDVDRTLRQRFGRNFVYFPMTPVSLEENELGIEDMAERSINPFGILEPVLWLLHMHGYQVLAD